MKFAISNSKYWKGDDKIYIINDNIYQINIWTNVKKCLLFDK